MKRIHHLVGMLAGCLLPVCALVSAAELIPVPRPDLAQIEDPRIRSALEGARAQLESQLADPDIAADTLAETFGDTGLQYQAHLLLEPAATCYRNAARLTPGDRRWPYYLGYLEQESSRLEAAAQAYQTALRLDPGFAVARLRLGGVYLQLGLLDRAEEQLERAARDPALHAAARFEQGKLAYARRDFAAAVRHLNEALEIAPEATRIHYTLALAYRGLGDLERAHRHLAQRGEREPAFPDPLIDLMKTLASGQLVLFHSGMSASQQGDYREAARFFAEGLALDPDNSNARVSLARFLYLSGAPEEARTELEAVLRRAPDHALARFLIGVLEDAADNAGQALTHLRRTLELEPRHAGAHYFLAGLLMRRGEYAAAARHYEASLEREPHNGSARLWQVLALIQAGAPHARLRTLLEAGLERDPDDGALAYLLAALLAASPDDRVRDGRRALTLARELHARHPSPEHAELLAMAHAENSDFSAAESRQSEALERAFALFRMDLVPRLSANLERFKAGKPCRAPWSAEALLYMTPPVDVRRVFEGYPPEAPF